ncbi:c-type cytochrome [Candidatus Reidiella endopervernicosa]|nr:c-type cytochrome [Candidatus Reidiella endopervernicosa]
MKLLILFLPLGMISTAQAVDLENGEEINELCAGCHGEYGEGDKNGDYPRLSGQPESFISKQMHLFRDRKRPNLPMLEYVDERQFPDQEIADVSAYLAQVELPTKLPPFDEENFDPLKRLLEAKRVVNIPRMPGDIEAGRKRYKRECRSCHGSEGWGDHEKGVPMLAGQYSVYLQRQVKKYLDKHRIHDPESPDDELLAAFTAQELDEIWAYLSTVDD